MLALWIVWITLASVLVRTSGSDRRDHRLAPEVLEVQIFLGPRGRENDDSKACLLRPLRDDRIAHREQQHALHPPRRVRRQLRRGMHQIHVMLKLRNRAWLGDHLRLDYLKLCWGDSDHVRVPVEVAQQRFNLWREHWRIGNQGRRPDAQLIDWRPLPRLHDRPFVQQLRARLDAPARAVRNAAWCETSGHRIFRSTSWKPSNHRTRRRKKTPQRAHRETKVPCVQLTHPVAEAYN